MESYSDFQYYNDKNGNSHGAGYLFNENCIQNGGRKNNIPSAPFKNLAIPGGLFYKENKSVLKNKSQDKGLINSFIFDKLFSCGVVEENTGKHTRKRKISSKKKTRRV